MERRYRLDVDAADPDRVTEIELEHLGEAHRANHRAATAGDDQRGGAWQAPQRRQVEMIVVEVRDQDGVHRVQVDVDRARPPTNGTDPGPKDGIGQDLLSGGLEEDRRVAEPRHPVHGRAPSRGARVRCDTPPAGSIAPCPTGRASGT